MRTDFELGEALKAIQGPYPDSEFDRGQLSCLGSLASQDANLYIPFYANTFPLGYHYSRVLPRRGTSKGAGGRIIRHIWSESIPETVLQKPTGISVLYGTNATVKTLKREIAARKKQDPNFKVKVEKTFFTDYQPCYFFTRNDHSSQLFLEDDVQVRADFDLVEVYTDVPAQAGIVRSYLHEKMEHPPRMRVIGDLLHAHLMVRSDNRILRLYFYGAPLTSSLLTKDEYRKWELPNKLWKPDQFRTHCIIVSPCHIDTSGIRSCLISYHNDLFKRAEEDCSQLRNVWWAYNRAADMILHPSRFQSERKYAACLTSHHKPGVHRIQVTTTAPTTVVPEGASTNRTGLHIHFGMGPLGMGFVLGLIRSERLVCLQKEGPATGAFLAKQSKHGKLRIRTKAIGSDHQPTNQYRDFHFFRKPPLVEKLVSQDSITIYDYNESSARERINSLIAHAESVSVSCRGGQEDVLDLLVNARLPIQVPVYWIENDVAKRVLSYKGIASIRCIPDRICRLDRRPNASTPGEVTVRCEEGPGVLQVPQDKDGLTKVFGENVGKSVIPISIDRPSVDFWHNRKLYLVNGFHSLLSVLSYSQLKEQDVPPEEWAGMPVSVFLQALSTQWRSQYQLQCYRLGQILRLISETNEDVIMRALGTSNLEDQFYLLLDYSDCAVKRVERTFDYIGRILDVSKASAANRGELKEELKGELEKKFKKHFKDAENSVRNNRRKILQLRIREAPSFCGCREEFRRDRAVL